MTYHFYHRVFSEYFNLNFNIPKKDQCDTCSSYRNKVAALLTEEEKQAQVSHLNEKELVRHLKTKIKEHA